MSPKSLVLPLIALLVGTPLLAEDRARGLFEDAGLERMVDDLADVILELGRSRIDAATGKLGELSPRNDAYENPTAQKVLEPFSRSAAEFSSVEFVGANEISSRAISLTLVAHANSGPMLFRFNVYRPNDEWVLLGVTFQSNWDQIAEQSRVGRFEKPVTILDETVGTRTASRRAPGAPSAK